MAYRPWGPCAAPTCMPMPPCPQPCPQPLPPPPVCTPGASFSAVLNAPSYTIQQTSSIIPFNQELTGSPDFNQNSGLFRVPTSGTYQFSFGLDLSTTLVAAPLVAGSAAVVSLVIGGTTTIAKWSFNASSTVATTETKAGVIAVPLTAGQQVSLNIQQPTALAAPNQQTLLGNQVLNTYPWQTWFSGVYIGA